MKYQAIREQVFATVLKAVKSGLIRLSAGNLSARTEDGLVAITPTSIKYDALKPEQIALVDLDGRLVDAPCPPSSETPMHTAILRHLPSVGAVLHTHSPYAITFAALGEAVPPVSLELYMCGAPIPVAPWACPGTAEAGGVTVDLFTQRPDLKVCLLRNHGLVAIGRDLGQAYEFAYDAEVGMQIYHQARLLGRPEVIDAARAAQIRSVYG